jgi:hypothetical protein
MFSNGKKRILDNPLIQRYRYSSLRPLQFWIYTIIYITIIVLILFINYTSYQYRSYFGGPADFFENVYFQFLIFQVLILWIWALKDEIYNKSYDFFRMLPLPAYQKAIGILIGRNLLALLFAGINCLFLLFLGLSGKVNFVLQVQILLTLVSIAVLANSAALLISTNTPQKKKSPNIIVLVVLGFFFIPFLLSALAHFSQTNDLEKVCAGFFTLQVPILLLITFIALYFSLWAFKGIIRKFNHESETLFTRKGAFVFMLGYEIVAIGLFYPYLSEEMLFTYFFWLASLIPAVLVLLGSIRNQDNYIEYSRSIHGRSETVKSMMSSLLPYSNLIVGLGLFAMWFLFSTGTIIATGEDLLSNLYIALVLFSFYLFFLLMVELFALYNSPNNKTGLLIGFIILLQMVVPPILASITLNDTIYLYSPFGYFASIIETPYRNFSIETSVLILNLGLCVIPAKLIWQRYNLILIARQKM